MVLIYSKKYYAECIPRGSITVSLFLLNFSHFFLCISSRFRKCKILFSASVMCFLPFSSCLLLSDLSLGLSLSIFSITLTLFSTTLPGVTGTTTGSSLGASCGSMGASSSSSSISPSSRSSSVFEGSLGVLLVERILFEKDLFYLNSIFFYKITIL